MDTIIVPCTNHKVWEDDPGAGPMPARRAYTDGYFADWCRYAEAGGGAWFVLSTHYGLVAPDEPVENYDVPVGEARRDPAYLHRLRSQLDARELGAGDVVVLDWERFRDLLATALDVPTTSVRLPLLSVCAATRMHPRPSRWVSALKRRSLRRRSDYEAMS
jgi:hypothetical protein